MAKWDEEDKVPRSLMEHITALGVCGMTVPEEYGGVGRDILGTMVTVEELSRRSMVIGTLYLMNACYGSMNILASGSDEQKQRLLPKTRQWRDPVRLRPVGTGCRLRPRQRQDAGRAAGRQGDHQRLQALVFGRGERRLHLRAGALG